MRILRKYNKYMRNMLCGVCTHRHTHMYICVVCIYVCYMCVFSRQAPTSMSLMVVLQGCLVYLELILIAQYIFQIPTHLHCKAISDATQVSHSVTQSLSKSVTRWISCLLVLAAVPPVRCNALCGFENVYCLEFWCLCHDYPECLWTLLEFRTPVSKAHPKSGYQWHY